MLRIAAVLLLGLAVANAAVFKEEEYQFLFSKFMGQYNKKYTHEQFFFRYTVFKANMDKIYLANKQNHSYTLGMNEMGDMTHDEFKATKLGYSAIKRPFARKMNTHHAKVVGAPAGKPSCPAAHTGKPSVDWVAAGAVTPIKNQGQCGSCWSFSATGSIEGAVQIATGTLQALSEQQLVDCSTSYGNMGCNGGLMDYAFEYVIDNKGLTGEDTYPYTASDDTCNTALEKEQISTISGYCDVKSGSETALMSAVAVGPVSVAIEADQSCFQFYSSGVMSDASCGTNLDHGVLAVGYGTTGGKKYWNVKNSWGTSWGKAGYIWLGRQVAGQSSGVCGIALAASYPTGGAVVKH